MGEGVEARDVSIYVTSNKCDDENINTFNLVYVL